jgi:hypothetical protein
LPEALRKKRVAWGALVGVVGAIALGAILIVRGDAVEPADVPVSCSVYDSDGGVRLTVEGEVTQSEAEHGCNELAARLSGDYSYWKLGAPPLPESEPSLVCALLSPEGNGTTAMVEEDPATFASTATSICGRLAHAGWIQDEAGAPGPWQREFASAVAAQEAIELEEQEVREAEAAEREATEAAIAACVERAEAAEEAELEEIERQVEAEVAAAATESEEYRIEEEGWEREEDAWEDGEAAIERCER